ncbi:hypothetical protein SDC9_179557 [bioreactor metagenome]|uniref:Uncharacterized protein n=1 Tax=bioreactor metagenome TaxID=1076179 RepID=A0A645GZ47_9ZZZZ
MQILVDAKANQLDESKVYCRIKYIGRVTISHVLEKGKV